MGDYMMVDTAFVMAGASPWDCGLVWLVRFTGYQHLKLLQPFPKTQGPTEAYTDMGSQAPERWASCWVILTHMRLDDHFVSVMQSMCFLYAKIISYGHRGYTCACTRKGLVTWISD